MFFRIHSIINYYLQPHTLVVWANIYIVLIPLLENLRELNKDGLESLSQYHTDIVCIASVLVVVVMLPT